MNGAFENLLSLVDSNSVTVLSCIIYQRKRGQFAFKMDAVMAKMGEVWRKYSHVNVPYGSARILPQDPKGEDSYEEGAEEVTYMSFKSVHQM